MPLIAIVGLLQSAIRESGLSGTWLSFSKNAAPLFVTTLWQGAVVALGLTICLRLAPAISAAHRFGVWATGFAAAVLLPSLSALDHATPGIMNSVRSDFVDTVSKPLFQLDARWGVGIAVLWLLAVAVRAVNLAFQAARLHELWKSAIPIKFDVGLTASLAVPTKILGRRSVEICTTNALQRPSVIGFIAPRILIPDWLLGRLTPGELEQIVLHEIEHLRRRDDWTNLIQKVGMVLFPLNPGLWWMERKLCLEREMACDEGVVRVTHAPRAYAACLATLAERGLQRRTEALSLGALQHRSELVRRVHGILLKKDKRNPAASIALMSAMSCALVLGSLELSRSPQLVSFVPSSNVELAHAAGPGQARLMQARFMLLASGCRDAAARERSPSQCRQRQPFLEYGRPKLERSQQKDRCGSPARCLLKMFLFPKNILSPRSGNWRALKHTNLYRTQAVANNGLCSPPWSRPRARKSRDSKFQILPQNKTQIARQVMTLRSARPEMREMELQSPV